MCRSQLEMNFFKTKTYINFKLYKKQENFCSKLYRCEKRKYFESLDMKNVSDKNTVISEISIEKIEKIYLMTLICLKGLIPSLKMLLDQSVSSQMRNYLSDTKNLSYPVENLKTIQVFKLLSKIFQ